MELRWCDGWDSEFVALAGELDAHLRQALGVRQAAFAPFNGLAQLRYAVVLYADGKPAACGALKPHENGVMEVKRVYVAPEARRHGLARKALAALEDKARSLGAQELLLETNPAFTPAVTLYQSLGFMPVEPFGPYVGMDTLCMGKPLL